MAPPRDLALCTTVYPGVEAFLPAWYESVMSQTDRRFRLWVALDGVTIANVIEILDDEPDATWVHGFPGDTPATIRQRILSQLVGRHDGVVLTDSDDVLHPDRVETARAALSDSELVACALRLVDSRGASLGATLEPAGWSIGNEVLPRHNVYGLSNTAWRCDMLQRCLPIPADVEIVDWYLSTRAWLLKATTHLDRAVGMDYRQHGANATRVRAPYRLRDVMSDTERVLRHLRLVLRDAPSAADGWRLEQIRHLVWDIQQFSSTVLSDDALAAEYVHLLNELDPRPLWWANVAHPSLRHLWA